jgi:hypothetical protein
VTVICLTLHAKHAEEEGHVILTLVCILAAALCLTAITL